MSGTVKTLVVLTLTLLVLEAALRLLDPWGAATYSRDMVTLRNAYVEDPVRHYLLPDGTLALLHWQVTMQDGTRVVPDSSSGDCTIIFVGDSVTFGHGVNDADTFVNRIAQALPGVQVRNAGINGYNLTDVLYSIEAIPANGYVYLMTGNDADAPYTVSDTREPPSVLLGYLLFAAKRLRPGDSGNGATASYPAWVDQSLAHLNRHDVLVLGFRKTLVEYATRFVPVQIIPEYIDAISPADGHPTPLGHKQIADAMLHYIRAFVERACEP